MKMNTRSAEQVCCSPTHILPENRVAFHLSSTNVARYFHKWPAEHIVSVRAGLRKVRLGRGTTGRWSSR